MKLKAVAVLVGDELARGLIHFEQQGEDSPVRIYGRVVNLKPGLHGFHVHQFGDMTNGCISAGPHYNPFNKSHGGPNDQEKHLGDLGNLIADENGVANFDIVDKWMRLNGPHSIVGRTIVVHQDPDDLGMGGTELSKAEGSSGARVCCGVIGSTNI